MLKDIGIPLITLLLGTFLGNFINFHNKSRELQDSLDARSNWRINLVNIASKENISVEDIYRVRASLRNVKHNPLEIELYSFDFMTNVMINICDKLIKRYDISLKVGESQCQDRKTLVASHDDCEIIRICCRFLLKHHWEYLTKGYRNPLLRKISFNSEINSNAEEVCKEIKKYGGEIDYV